MPKRVIDFDAMWGSDKLAACADWAQAEYAWLYGLADASGCFEVTNLRVIWGRVAAIRRNLTIERLEQVFAEFQDRGLLFVWEHEGKRYGHWTGSDVPGRLPAPSWRMRLERFAPPVPKQQLAEYMSRFARGRAALAGAGFGAPAARVEERGGRQAGGSHGSVRSGLKAGLEAAQGQDLGLNLDLNREVEGNWEIGRDRSSASGARCAMDEIGEPRTGDLFSDSQAQSGVGANSGGNEQSKPKSNAKSSFHESANSNANSCSDADSRMNLNSYPRGNGYSSSYRNSYSGGLSARELAVERELRVGQGPVCGPGKVREEILERVRRRDAARAAASRSG